MIKKYMYFILAISTILLIIDGLLTNNNQFNLFSIELNKLIYLSILSIFAILFIAFGVKKR